MAKSKPDNDHRTIKTVSFSKTDPIEKAMLKHALSFDHFATYVKRLIQRDMEKTPTGSEGVVVRQVMGQSAKILAKDRQ